MSKYGELDCSFLSDLEMIRFVINQTWQAISKSVELQICWVHVSICPLKTFGMGTPIPRKQKAKPKPNTEADWTNFLLHSSGLDVLLPAEPVGWTLRLPTGTRDATWQMSLSRPLVPFCVHLLTWKCHQVLVKLLIKLWRRPMSARVISMLSWQLMPRNLAGKLRVSRSRLESLCGKVCNQAA